MVIISEVMIKNHLVCKICYMFNLIKRLYQTDIRKMFDVNFLS